VGGDVQTGAGGTVEASGNAAISGDVSDESEKEIPSVEIPSSLSSLVSLGSYSVSANSTETLISGDYKFSSFTVSGNGRVVLEGSVNLYLTSTSEALKISGNGNVIVSPGADVKVYTEGKTLISGNGISNSTNLPEKLILYSTYSDTGEGVKISGNGDFFGAVYAPDASIKVSGNGDVFGAILGDEALVTGNGNVHYDEALGRLNTGSCRYSVEEWKESEGTYVVE
ncbi:MAG: collagen-binding domain-containing protein, partial [Candidatus Omnitrophota bacterium]